MFDKLKALNEKFNELERSMADPSVAANPEEMRKLGKGHAELLPIVTVYRHYCQLESDLEAAKELLKEELAPEEAELLQQEIASLQRQMEEAEAELKVALLPKDPNDEKNVLVEIRAGTGGDEAALFAADLFRMYTRYAEKLGWRLELMSSNPTELGGFKEVIFMIEGKGAYSQLKYEGGVHRVQRIP
ncbi:MAG: PCRF domain-containing protein, partial [Firmicutes bacterium]|nr:PCRF domain-containing protein [Bacillota bacterium]